MSDKDRLVSLIENKNYMISNISITNNGEHIITLLHKGGGPPPEGENVIICSSDSGCINYANKYFHGQ